MAYISYLRVYFDIYEQGRGERVGGFEEDEYMRN